MTKKSLAVALQCLILMAASGLSRAQSAAPHPVQPSASSGTQTDPYIYAFAGLTYTDKQKEAIGKIRQDIDSRKAMVEKTANLNQDQKDAMLTGYTRLEYNQIYEVLTPEQKKRVSNRFHEHRAAQQPAPKAPAPTR